MNNSALSKNTNKAFLEFIKGQPTASYETYQHNPALVNLAHCIGKDKLLFIDSNYTVDNANQPTANSIAVILFDEHYQPSNLAIFPLDNAEPFPLHGLQNDCFILGNGGQVVAVASLDTAIELYPYLTIEGKYSLIAPLKDWQFERMVKAHASHSQVTLFTDYPTGKQLETTFKGHNVRLVATVDTITDLVISYSLDEIINDPNKEPALQTKVKELNGIEWGEPEPLGDSHEFINPYPLHAFSDELRAVIERASYYYQTPKSVAGQAVLGALSTMCQPYVNAPFAHSHNPVSLFLLVELPSGGGKTQINKYIYKAIDEIDRQYEKDYQNKVLEYQAELASAKGQEKKELILDGKPKSKSFVMASATLQYITRKFVIDGVYNLAITSGEAGKMMGSHSMKAENIHDTIGTFADLYSGQRVEYNTSGNQKETGKTQAYDCRLTIDISGQPAILRDVINNELLMQQGFLARFLISCEPSLIGKRVYDDIERELQDSENDPALLRFWARCKDFYNRAPTDNGMNQDGTPNRFNMLFGGGAMRYLNAYRQHCENRLTTTFKNHQETAQRLAENASRVATLMAYFDGLDKLPIEYLEKGILLAEYSIKELMRYNDQQQASEKSDSQKLIEWLIKQCKAKSIDRLSYAEAQSKVSVRALRRKAEFELAIAVLVDKQYIKVIEQEKSRYIYINPQALK